MCFGCYWSTDFLVLFQIEYTLITFNYAHLRALINSSANKEKNYQKSKYTGETLNPVHKN